jgi:hypothetical protein
MSKVTWLTPSVEVWEQHYGVATVNFGRMAKALSGLYPTYTPEHIAQHLKEYLSQTPPQFLNLNRFAETFMAWKPKQLVDDDGVLIG